MENDIKDLMHRKKYCRYCEYRWISRTADPKQCPRCKRYFMNVDDNKKVEE